MSEVLYFIVGTVFGALLALVVTERASNRAVRLARTGKPDLAVPIDPAKVNRLTAPSPEASAMREISESAVRVGTEQLLAAAKDEGVYMSRTEAEKAARDMLTTTQPLGGAH